MTHITPPGFSAATTELLEQNVLHSPPTELLDPHSYKIKRHRKPKPLRTNNTHKRRTGFGTGTTLTGVYLILSAGGLEDVGGGHLLTKHYPAEIKKKYMIHEEFSATE